MKRATLLTIVVPVILAFVLAMPIAGMAEGGSVEVTGKIYCIDTFGNMTAKDGVCPIDHIAHVIITVDGEAIMLGGGKKMEKKIRKMSYPAGTKVKVKGKRVKELNAIDVEELTIVGGG